MKEKLALYIEKNMEKERAFFGAAKCCAPVMEEEMILESRACSSIDDYIDSNKDENKFQKLLFNHIDRRNLKDSDVYNKAHIDRRLFSKIRSDSNYHPSKETVILLGLSLELNEKEIEDLLASASYYLPKNNYYDLIIRFCFINKIYDVFEVNELLDSYKCKLFI